MSDTKISDLPVASSAASTDYLVGDFGTPPRTKKIRVGDLTTGASPGSAVASLALSAGSLTYVKADGTLALADATAEGKEAVSFVSAAFAQGATASHYFNGIISGFVGLTPGADYFMSKTPGGIASAATVAAYVTGNVVMRIGTAISATQIAFSPTIPVTL